MRRKLCTAVLTLALLCTLAPNALAFDTAYAGRMETLGQGGTYSLSLDESGAVWGWGLASVYYELGTSLAIGVPDIVLEGMTSLSAGVTHAGAVDADGALWMWGSNDYGEIGNYKNGEVIGRGREDVLIQTKPVKVLDRVAAVSCGYNATAAIRTDGTLWTWGNNFSGELGCGGEEDSLVPVQVLENVAAVQTGLNFFSNQTIAVKTDGSVWAWGANAVVSEDGVWETSDSRVPVECPALHGSVPGSMDQARSMMARYSEPLITCSGDDTSLSAYALLDANGNRSYYIKLYELYSLMPDDLGVEIAEGETVRFATGAVETAYDGEGGSMLPFPADRICRPAAVTAYVDGQPHALSALVLTDDNGTEYTYYKLRDLGLALGFDVGWSAGTGATVDFPPPGAE